jgi:hypothetical protein
MWVRRTKERERTRREGESEKKLLNECLMITVRNTFMSKAASTYP